jgi:hypothetical protein
VKKTNPPLCDGFPHPESCPNPAGHPRLKGLPANRNWCESCDRKRMAHLDKRFAEIEATLNLKKTERE